MDVSEIVSLTSAIREAGLFSTLTGPQLESLAAHCREVLVPAGDLVYLEGDLGGDVYIVLEGRVSLEMSQPGGPAIRLRTAGPGEFLGGVGLDPAVPQDRERPGRPFGRGISATALRPGGATGTWGIGGPASAPEAVRSSLSSASPPSSRGRS